MFTSIAEVKRQALSRFGDDSEKWKPSDTAGGIVKWDCHLGKQFGSFSKC